MKSSQTKSRTFEGLDPQFVAKQISEVIDPGSKVNPLWIRNFMFAEEGGEKAAGGNPSPLTKSLIGSEVEIIKETFTSGNRNMISFTKIKIWLISVGTEALLPLAQ